MFIILGDSASMMDHYYDKLLQIAVFKPEVVNNTYLVQEASKEHLVLTIKDFQFLSIVFKINAFLSHLTVHIFFIFF